MNMEDYIKKAKDEGFSVSFAGRGNFLSVASWMASYEGVSSCGNYHLLISAVGRPNLQASLTVDVDLDDESQSNYTFLNGSLTAKLLEKEITISVGPNPEQLLDKIKEAKKFLSAKTSAVSGP